MNLYYFNINKNCNSNCIFCAADYEKMVSHNIISNSYICFEDFKNIAENISIKQEDRVIINGGEPTLNPDLIKILNYCSLLEAETILFTNGRKLGNTGYAKSILQSGISKITIPFYGHNAEIHDSITRSKNSFHETVRGLSNLNDLHKNEDYILELKILICRNNYNHINEIAEYLISNFKFDNLLLSGLIPSDVAIKNNQTVPRKLHMEAVNQFFDFYWKCDKKPSLIVDGIPLCHLNDKNRMLYLFYRKNMSQNNPSRIDGSYYIDVEDSHSVILSQEINSWNKPICENGKCKYLSICRLNTLLNHKAFLKEWIHEQKTID